MAVVKLFRKTLDENEKDGTIVKQCTADVRQVALLKQNGWVETAEEAEKVTKASLEKEAKAAQKKAEEE